MKKQFRILALLLVVGAAWAAVNQVQTLGNYGVTDNKIYIQHFQDSLWQDPASTGSYPVTWFNNDNSRKELIYVTGKTPTAGLTPANVIATRGYGSTSPIEHFGPCSAYLVVLPTYTPTDVPTATPTFTPTRTPTNTPFPIEVHSNGPMVVGATAGFVINAANDLGYLATLPESQTSSTLKISIPHQHTVGQAAYWKYKQFWVSGATFGSAVTATFDLRAITQSAAVLTDGSVASKTVTFGSASGLTSANGGVTFAAASMQSNAQYYILVTASSGGSSGMTITGASLIVDQY